MSMTCVCFAEPSFPGVAEPFLTQKRPFVSPSEPFLAARSSGRTRRSGAYRPIHRGDLSRALW
jgi:hypothetical protein